MRFRAEILSFVAIYSAIGLRDDEIGARLGQALRRTSFPEILTRFCGATRIKSARLLAC